MTKAELVRRLYADGVRKLAELARQTGVSYGYAANIVSDIRNPGSLTARTTRWRGRQPAGHATEAVKRWRRRHAAWTTAFRKRQHRRFQTASRGTAWEHGKSWNMRQIRFLRANRGILTIRQMAKELGKTFVATREAVRRYARTERPVGNDWNLPEPT